MSAADLAVLVAAVVCAVTAVALVVVVVVLGRRVGDLSRAVEELRAETVPLVRDARVVVDQAATEMVRVGDVLDSAEAVSATVDSASRLAYRALANPVVKLLAYGTGAGSALRRLFSRRPSGAARLRTSPNGRGPASAHGVPATVTDGPGPGRDVVWRGAGSVSGRSSARVRRRRAAATRS